MRIILLGWVVAVNPGLSFIWGQLIGPLKNATTVSLRKVKNSAYFIN